MGMKIDSTKVIKLLPTWMRDDEANQALAQAMDQLFSAAGARVKTPRVWDQLESLTDPELDEIAWELGIDWYVSSWDRTQKINTIRIAGSIMEKRGTKWAVEQLVVAAFGVGQITEWFEYGGDPFYFKIITSATLTPDGMQTFLGMIERVKSTRSHVESISVVREIDQELFAGCATRAWIHNIILEGTVRAYTIQQEDIFPATGYRAHIHNPILEGYTDSASHSFTVNTGTAASSQRTRNTIH